MLKSKTVWTAVLGAVGGLAGILTGDLATGEGINVIITSILAIFLRHGIAKQK
tara:strand:- start:382 stop:540 length:159 start_codon:yes stop_codon:yes gene_type:complete